MKPNLPCTFRQVVIAKGICSWTRVRLTALGFPNPIQAGGGRQLEPLQIHALGTTKPSFRSGSVFKAPPFCFAAYFCVICNWRVGLSGENKIVCTAFQPRYDIEMLPIYVVKTSCVVPQPVTSGPPLCLVLHVFYVAASNSMRA